MAADAETHAADDAKRKELVEARNIADQGIYAAEKAVKEYGSKVGGAAGDPDAGGIVKEVQDKIDALKTARASEDTGTIKTATEALSSALSKIGEVIAKQTQTPPASDAGGQNPPPSGDTPPATDAEFKEKP